MTASALVFADTVHPAKLSIVDLIGRAFDAPNTMITATPTGNILDITSLKSSDGKFVSGMYKAGKLRFEITEPYGVDEFPRGERRTDVLGRRPNDHQRW